VKFLLVNTTVENHGHNALLTGLRRGLEEIGQQAVITQQPIGDPNGLARELAASRYEAVVSFSSVFGDAVTADGRSLFDAAGVKFLGWQLDHPIYTHHTLCPPMGNRRSVYSNHNHMRFSEAVGIQGRSMVLLPGGQAQPGPVKAYAAREWPVFVAATWNGLPERPWEAMEESPGKQLFMAIIDQVMADPEASVLDSFDRAAIDLGFDVQLGRDAAFDNDMMGLLRTALTYCRYIDRIEVIRHLVEAGIPLTICGPGRGWRDYLGDPKGVTFIERWVDFGDLAPLYDNARITLNLNAGNGACERAVYAMISGAAVVSDFSGDLAKAFAADEEIAFFNRVRPGEIVDAVGGLLEGGRGEAVAHKGHARALKSALWRHRAEALVAFCSADA
jgi:hypothetical protein